MSTQYEQGKIRGGCPCGFWSASNCKKLRTSRLCDSERVRVGLPMLTPQEHAELDAHLRPELSP